MKSIYRSMAMLLLLMPLMGCALSNVPRVPSADETPSPELIEFSTALEDDLRYIRNELASRKSMRFVIGLDRITDETQRFQINGDGIGDGGFVPRNSMILVEPILNGIFQLVDWSPEALRMAKERVQLKNQKLLGNGQYYNIPGEKGPVAFQPLLYGELTDFLAYITGQFTSYELTNSKGGFVSVWGMGPSFKHGGSVVSIDMKMVCSDQSTLATAAIRAYAVQQELGFEIGRFLPPKTTDVLVLLQYSQINRHSEYLAQRLGVQAAALKVAADVLGISFKNSKIFKPTPEPAVPPIVQCMERRQRLMPPPAPPKAEAPKQDVVVRVPFKNHVRTCCDQQQRDKVTEAKSYKDKGFNVVDIVGFTCPETEVGSKLDHYRRERAEACAESLGGGTYTIRGATHEEQERYNQFLAKNPNVKPHPGCLIRLRGPAGEPQA